MDAVVANPAGEAEEEVVAEERRNRVCSSNVGEEEKEGTEVRRGEAVWGGGQHGRRRAWTWP